MQQLVTDRVAEKMNWAGRGEKLAFRRMTLFAVVCGKCAGPEL